MQSRNKKGEAPVIGPTEASMKTTTAIKQQELSMDHSTQVGFGGAISLTVIDGQPTTTSNEVAQHFGKQHQHVMERIRSLTAETPNEFNQSNFRLVETTDAKGEKRPAYCLTRDGFTLLAMGFTGKKALAFKLAYIDAFNRMERELNITTPTPIKPTNLTPAQKQNLHELVDIVVSSGKQTHAETWARFHRKFHVNSYHELPADQFDAACQYLRGKLEGHDIGSLVKKHFPAAAPALPAPTGTERMLITKNLATGETTVENLGTESLFFKSPDHVARAVMDCRLGVEVTQKIAQHAMMGMMANAVDLKKQIRSQAVTETLSMMNNLPVADLVELSTSAHTFLAGMALKTPPLPSTKGDRLLDAALAASAHA